MESRFEAPANKEFFNGIGESATFAPAARNAPKTAPQKIAIFRSNQESSGECRFNFGERSWLEKRIDGSLFKSLD
jgi:hypothetical protein